MLIEEGIEVLLQTLFQFQESTRFHQLRHILCVATATIRQAENQEEIKKLVEGQTDFTLRVLSEYEEARYGYLAVMNSTSFSEGDYSRYWWRKYGSYILSEIERF